MNRGARCIAIAIVLTLGACRSRGAPPAPVPAAPSGVPEASVAEGLDEPITPTAAPGLGPLVPWRPASEWHGKPGSVPPKEFSLFAVSKGTPIMGYAALDRDACEAELGRRSIPFVRASDTAGVRAPVRLGGPLHGVAFHSAFPPAQRAKSKADLVDCRLALSLDDFGATLAARGIVDVVIQSAYRTKAEYGCTVKYPGEQHCAALAIDVASFGKKDGTRLVVERDFAGAIGLLTCGTGAAPKNELWDIVCSAAGRHFHVVLTPNWNAEHKNHLHFELGVHDWLLVR